MAVSPTGPISKPVYNLQTLLANSAAFQTWVGATGTAEEKVTAARARIYIAAKPGADVLRPHALIWVGDEWDSAVSSGGAVQHFLDRGTLYMDFIDDVDEDDKDDHGDALLAFTNNVGAVIGEIEALAGSNGYLVVNRISKRMGPVRASVVEEDSLGDYYFFSFDVGWGVGA